MNLTEFIIVGAAGFILGALVFTQTGRQVSGSLSRAAAARAEHYIRPRRR